MAQTVEEVYRGVMGQTLVVKLLPLHFNKAGFFGKAIVITTFIGKIKKNQNSQIYSQMCCHLREQSNRK